MKIKQKFLYTKEKRLTFTQQQWNDAMAKAIKDHPELAEGKIEGIEDLKIKTKVNNERRTDI